MTLNNLAKRINETSTAHGFWPTHDQELEDIDMLLECALDSTSVGGGLVDAANRLRAKLTGKEVRNMGEMLMLAVSELAEALEEHRSGHPVHYHKVTVKPDTQFTAEAGAAMQKLRDNADMFSLGNREAIHEVTAEDTAALVDCGIAKPEGLAVELADCIIRCLDTMQSLGVDIDHIVDEKMRYNDSREHKHGRAY